VLHFDYNKLGSVNKSDLLLLDRLEVLKLDHNLVEDIEQDSFANLVNLESLDLSNNRISWVTNETFNKLANLKFIYLGSNRLSLIESYLFDGLNKLEVVDLSGNSIHSIGEYAFNRLVNLKDLYLWNNVSAPMIIEYKSFVGLDSIQNVFVSETTASELKNRLVFKQVVGERNGKMFKSILKRKYFRSFNLITAVGFDEDHDCQLTFWFIKYNIHFNLKDDFDYVNYLKKCNHLSIL
jgi:hypothetical protein